ncbi:MAG: hypothetical protein GYB67_18480, partial [Chloroflexi bacterium]|nr:hypothetical protein [Chloroflexota bacterium]
MRLSKIILFLALCSLLVTPLVGAAQDTLPEPVAAGEIALGEIIDAELTADAPALEFTFDGEADDLIDLTMTSLDFDTYLVLLDEDGAVIAEDDDGAGNLNSRIGPFELPADGTYTVVAQSFVYNSGRGVLTGEFMLSLQAGTFEPTATPTLAPSPTPSAT